MNIIKECSLCGGGKNVIMHHISYYPEKTIPLCQKCHVRLPKEHPDLLPPKEDTIKFRGIRKSTKGLTKASTGLIPTSDASKIIDVSSSTLLSYVKKGFLNCITLPSGHRRFRKKDVEEMISKQNTKDDSNA